MSLAAPPRYNTATMDPGFAETAGDGEGRGELDEVPTENSDRDFAYISPPRRRRKRLTRVCIVVIRRFVQRLEWRSPEWIHDLPALMGSVLFHTLVLLLLALWWFQDSPRTGGGRRAIDSAFSDDRTGGELAKLDTKAPETTEEPFSPAGMVIAELPPIPTESPVTVPAPEKTLAFPTNSPNPAFAPADPSLSGPLAGGTGAVAPSFTAPSIGFGARVGVNRSSLVRREGGNEASEAAVELGLNWLARHQQVNGCWLMDYHGRCQNNGRCPMDRCMNTAAGATGLALLPILGAGHHHRNPGPYQQTVSRGLLWLIKNQAPNGNLHQGEPGITWMYSHAIATMALCEAYGMTHDETLRNPARKALQFLIKSQNSADGGWRYTPGSPGDTSVFGWQMLALRSAKLAELSIPKDTLKRCGKYLDLAATSPDKATYSYRPGRETTMTMTAEGLVMRQLLGWTNSNPALQRGTQLVIADLQRSQERNLYYWYYATQLLHNVGGEPWSWWNPRIRDGLIATQTRGEDCARGSWDPLLPIPDAWDSAGGRLYTTSLSLLTLEVYYRYPPLSASKTPDDDSEDTPAPPTTPNPKANANANANNDPKTMTPK